ncbi:MAG: hypothetical protein IT580_07875 [Verrucomicrobiales bacterium]|nr:hypothetical protein [Verrucomicrobiales bacterium]
MTTDDARWRELPVLRELHDQWWKARGRRLGESTRPFSRDWERLLEDAGLLSAELRAEADRDARLLQRAGLLELQPPRLRPHFILRVRIPVAAELRLAQLFDDPQTTTGTDPRLVGTTWEPELAFLREARTQVDFEDWLALNQFLASGGRHRPVVPIKERSLQIFGDEKRLDALLVAAPFRTGSLSPETFRCRLVGEPLGWRRGPSSHPPVLVVENAATWDSFCRWNDRVAAFSAVVYGRGLAFAESVTHLREIFRELGGVRPLFYFGDLDPAGLEIPARASRRALAEGWPPIAPHRWSYQHLLQAGLGHETPWEGPDASEEALRWLGDLEHAARSLFSRGQRLAQEHVGWEWLEGHGMES